jgi:hypothetical protein
MTTISRQDDDQARESATVLPHERPPSAALERLASPALQGLLAFGIYLAWWIPFEAWSLVRHPTAAQLLQNSPDPNFYVWCLRWWPYAIGHGLNPLYSSQIFAPGGHALAWVTTAAPLALLAFPVTVIAGPVVTFNLLTAIALPAAAWAAFLLCRRLTGMFWPALVGGAVFGFSSYQLNHNDFGQLNLTYCLLLPIMAYLIVLWRDEVISARTFAVLAAVTMTLQFYLATETFADMTAILGVSLVAGFALAGQSGRPPMLRLARLMAAAYAVGFVLAAPLIAYALTTRPPRPLHNDALDLVSLVLPRPGGTLGIAPLAHAAARLPVTSTDGYVGVPLLVVAVLLALTGWSSRLVRFLSCTLVIIVVASLGPVVVLNGHQIATLPWARLYHLPIAHSAYPARLMLFAFLVLAVVTALWLARADTARWLRLLLAVLVVAAIAANTSAGLTRAQTTVPSFISSGQYRRSLSPGEIVVVVSTVRNAGMLWQAESDFYMRLAGGFINEGYSHRHSDFPPSVQELNAPTPSRVAQFEAFVKSSNVGAVLVDAAHAPGWASIFAQIGLIGHRMGNVVIYVTGGCRSCRPWAVSSSASAR